MNADENSKEISSAFLYNENHQQCRWFQKALAMSRKRISFDVIIAYEQQRKASYETSPIKEILMQQDYLNDIEGIPFYTILSKDAHEKVKTMVTEHS